MKKNEFAKKSRKLFSAILAGAMLTTSVIPETFVWAADVEEVQGFGDSESMGFESTPDPVTGDGEVGENQKLSDFQGVSDIQNGNEIVDMEGGFTDEIASFGSNGSDIPAESGFQSQASVEELQERINSLPTVEEFQNLADGTTVEGSTLNQVQTDVYAEAQDIAEKLDLLSEEEQGLVDVSRLEAMLGYFNGMTEELAETTINVTSASDFGVTTSRSYQYTRNNSADVIVYEVQSGTYVLQKDIKLEGALYIASDKNVTIDLNGYTLDRGLTEATQNGFGIDCRGTLTLKDSSKNQTGKLTGAFNKNNYDYNCGGAVLISGGGKFLLKSGTISENRCGDGCDYCGTVVNGTKNSTFIMEGGRITKNGSQEADSADVVYMVGGTIELSAGSIDDNYGGGINVIGNFTMTGGIITKNRTSAAAGVRIKGAESIVKISGGSIINNIATSSGGGMVIFEGTVNLSEDVVITGNTAEKYGAGIVCRRGKLNIKDRVIISGNKTTGLEDNVALEENSKITINGPLEEGSKIGINIIESSQNYSTKLKGVVTNGYGENVSQSQLKYFFQDEVQGTSSFTLIRNSSNELEIIDGHTHSWKYKTAGNTVKAYCDTDSPQCAYYGTSSDTALQTADLVLNAPEMKYTGAAYDKASITENEITYVTGASASTIAYYKETAELDAAPTDAGEYTAKVTIGNETASADFSIIKADITPTVSLDDWVYGNTASNPNLTGNSGNGAVTYYYKQQGEEDSAYRAVTDFSTIPAGAYILKASIAESTNYNSNVATCNFTVTKQPITVTVTIDGWTYGETAKNPSAIVKAGTNDITDESQITYTYYTDSDCKNKTTSANGSASDGEIPKNAGTYYVKADVAERGNYTYANDIKDFTINKRTAELTWSNPYLTYTGIEQSVSVTVENAVDGDSFAITYKGNTQTEVGDSYTATVTDLGNDNYTLTGATGVSQNWSISYLQTSAVAQPFGKKGNNDWYVSAVLLVPENDYEISIDRNTWRTSLAYSDPGEHSVTYYLKDAKGHITDKKTATFKIDTEAPTGEIEIGANTFSSSPNTVTYGYWFRDNAAVDITGADSTSGIASIEYQKVKTGESYNENGAWITWDAVNKLSLTESGKYVIYACITDNAGNQAIINSDGVVVFKDSVVVDSSIDYTRTTKDSVVAEVTLNGNTVASVKNGETTLVAGKDYTVSADKITFSGDYLDTLAVGSYTMTVAYNPLGVTKYTGGDKPADSQITVNVKRQTANIEITSVLDKEYDGHPADLVYTTNSNANVKVEYNVNGIWQTEAPTHAGTYEVKVSVPKNGDFTAASDTKTYTIKQREVAISGITANAKVYDGTAGVELDYSKVAFTGLVEGDILTVSAKGAFADSNAAKGKKVTITNLVLGGASADNYVLAVDGQQTSTTADINPREITVTITPNGGTYEGNITPATAILNGLVGKDNPAITLTYTGTANDGTTADGKVPSKAGTYTVTASINDSNYSLKEEGSSAKFIVEKASPQLNVSAVKDKNYGEEAFKLEVSHKGDGFKSYASSNDKVIKVDENGTVTIGSAGTATLTVFLAESENYTKDQKEVTVTVKKINHSLVVDGIDYEVTYGDPDFKIAANAGDTESGIHFTSDNKNVATVSADGTVTIKNVGTAKITVSMEESQNYLAVSREVTIKVAPKEITATITPNGGTYEGTITPVTAVLNGLVGADKPEITLTYTGTANDGTKVNGTQVPSLAGTYSVTASITDSNYTLKPEGATAEFVIAKANPVLDVSPVADKIYGDEAFKLETSHKGNGLKSYTSSNDKVAKIDENGTVTITGAGTATLTISLAESANYTADRKFVTVTVMPKEITVAADNQKKIIGEADPVLTYTADGLVGADTLSGITLERKAGEKVGTYAVTASQAAGANPNYKITFKKGTFTIQQADQSRMKGKYVYSLRLPSFFAKGKTKKSSVALSWKKYAGADGYDVFWRYCDGSINYERAGTVKNGKLSMTHKKLKNDREYKYFIAAYKMVEGRKIYIAKSNGIHVAMKQASRTNAVSIKVNRTKVTLKAGKTFKLKCEVKPENSQKKLLSHSSVYSLSTSNSKIATVNKNGVIEAKAKGTCSIYVLANNGVYKRVKVIVK